MCALSTLGTAAACGTDTFQLTGIVDHDTVQLSCPDSAPPLADMSRTKPLSIYTGPSCPNLLAQIGCEGSYCQGLAYLEGYQNVALAYPMLSPAARLRVRVLRSIYSSVKWTVSFSGGDPTFVDQANSQWLEIAVPDDATQIALRTSCTSEAATFYVGVVNNCLGSTLTVRSPAQEPATIPDFIGVYVTAYVDFPRLSIEATDGRVFCVRSYRSGNNQCGTSLSVDADGALGYDQFDVQCP